VDGVHPFSSFFRARVEESARALLPNDQALEPLLRAALHAARTAWPKINIPDADFLAYVADRISPREPNVSALRTSDLWVACACIRGDVHAHAILDAEYFSVIGRALSKMRLPSEQVDDVRQGLREHLLVGNGTPHLLEYTGIGDLRAWIKVSAVRAGLKVLRKEKREANDGEDALLEEEAAGDDPEISYIKQVFRTQFKTAFQAALDSLSARDKNLLRQHVVDRLTVDEVGALYNVHRATAARWIEAARELLLTETRRHFMTHARISRAECDSIMRLVHSQLDGTIRRRLDVIGQP
jgi:RNA polymerase sigma-70 factor (ECF subfamily)